MTSPHLVIDSYIFFTLLFYLLIYLFIFKFFFHKGKVTEGIILPDVSGVSSNQTLPCIHSDEVRYPVLSEVKKKWFLSDRRVSHL